MHHRRMFLTIGFVLLLALLGTSGFVWARESAARKAEQALVASSAQRDELLHAIAQERTLAALLVKAKDLGVTDEAAQAALDALRLSIKNNTLAGLSFESDEIIGNLLTKLANKEAEIAAAKAEAARFGTLALAITNGAGAEVIAEQAGQTPVTSTADGSGYVSLKLLTGVHTVTIKRSGYQTVTLENITIVKLETLSQSVTLTAVPKTTSTPKPQASSAPVSSSTTYSSYRKETVSSSRGSFTADIMEFELGAGKVKVIADTAADGDCATNCPTLSVGGYASRHSGAIAAIHGTYFCPTDYSWCHPNEVNAFFWKIKAPRLGFMINSGNGLGENDGFLTFSSVGNPTYYSRWSDAPGSVYTGINHKPTVVKNGSYNVIEGELDEKQRTSKITRAAIGVKGSKAYAVIVSSATVMDLGAVMEALGVDTALNLDGGGSAAMWYNGVYKRGPGRSVPNAIVFVEQ